MCKKMNPIFSHIFSGLIGFFLAVLLAEFLLPWVSINIVNREHLLDIQIRELPFLKESAKDRVLTLNLKNTHSAFSVEDINLNVGFPYRIEKIIVSDDGVLGYEISKGRDALSITTQDNKVEQVPSNHRNIKIRKLFPGSVLALSIFLDTKTEGNGEYAYNPSDLKSVKYSMEYSYKFWGATVRRKIDNKHIAIRYSE